MKWVPHEFQEWGVKQVLARPAYALLLSMGFGKTVVMLTALERLINDKFEVHKCLVIAPLRVARDTWAQECNKWDHLKGRLRLSICLGSAEERKAALGIPADVYIINRENVPWLVEYYTHWPFDCVVVDELSSFKSHASERFKALRKVRPKINRFYGLTGTPAPNGLLDLWSQIYLLDRGERLGTGITKYRNRWFFPAKKDWQDPRIVYEWAPLPGATGEIYGLIKDISASVENDQVKLPPFTVVDHWVDIPMTEYREMLKTDTLGDILAVNAAATINKLLQIANGGIYDEHKVFHPIHEVKLDKLEDIIEAANGRNVLVFYSYTFDRDRILDRFARAVELRSAASVQDWMDGKISIGVAHHASCGHGLNLQSGGSILVWYGCPWSLEGYQQAVKRLHRQGQTEAVFEHRILARGTVDEDVVQRLEGKNISQLELLHKLLRRPARV